MAPLARSRHADTHASRPARCSIRPRISSIARCGGMTVTMSTGVSDVQRGAQDVAERHFLCRVEPSGHRRVRDYRFFLKEEEDEVGSSSSSPSSFPRDFCRRRGRGQRRHVASLRDELMEGSTALFFILFPIETKLQKKKKLTPTRRFFCFFNETTSAHARRKTLPHAASKPGF